MKTLRDQHRAISQDREAALERADRAAAALDHEAEHLKLAQSAHEVSSASARLKLN